MMTSLESDCADLPVVMENGEDVGGNSTLQFENGVQIGRTSSVKESTTNLANANANVPDQTAPNIETDPIKPVPTNKSGKIRPRPPKPKVKTDSKKKSKVWDHFSLIDGYDPDRPRAACNYCGKDYGARGKQDGTSNMWTHLNSCSKNPYKKVDKNQQTLCFVKKEEEDGKEFDGPSVGSLKSVSCNEKTCRDALAKMIIIDELPFRQVEKEGFKNFCVVMQPRFNVPSRTTVARDCLKLFYEEKEKLKIVLKKQRLCLTTDTWTSIQNLNYMCLTGHWIDEDWNLHKRILNFCLVSSHKGEVIGKCVEKCLLEWGIDSILTITVDNASSNDSAIRYLKRKTKDWASTVLENEFIHMRCCAHIVNLIVCEGLKEQNESISKIRNAVRYVRSSPSRLQIFKNCVHHEKISSNSLLCLDLPTRWNSTYMMLEAAEKFQKAFERLEEDDTKFVASLDIQGCPTYDDWDNARIFIRFLKLFYNVTLRLSGSLYVTSNAFFHELVAVQSKLVSLSKKEDYLLSTMALSMKSKYDKYWDNLDNINFLLYVAVVLDPRYKLRYVKFSFSIVYDDPKAEDLTKRVTTSLVRLYDQYLKTNGGGVTLRESQFYQEMDIDDEDDAMKAFAFQYKKHLMKEDNVENKSEIDRYFADDCEDPTIPNFDILGWWKLNSSKYRILSQIARDVLAIPVSTVASESAFSTGGRVLDSFRSSLTPKMVEALICTQNWLRSSSKSINLREYIDDIESYEEIESEFDKGKSIS